MYSHVTTYPLDSRCAFFFFSMFRPPPGSTLFPYTTLFRSRPRQPCRWPLPQKWWRRWSCPLARPPLDRKSTRLNSSHVSISYAVFCLKKKKRLAETLILVVEREGAQRVILGHVLLFEVSID